MDKISTLFPTFSELKGFAIGSLVGYTVIQTFLFLSQDRKVKPSILCSNKITLIKEEGNPKMKNINILIVIIYTAVVGACLSRN
ncbi:hypothetical protein BN1013_00941 [Candidatus Rubidus massiliensis]|nr:hypothetical protein BN1013_00941 [Candidatus Rubidus massiliensis]